MLSAAFLRCNSVTLRTQKVIQGGDNGHVGLLYGQTSNHPASGTFHMTKRVRNASTRTQTVSNRLMRTHTRVDKAPALLHDHTMNSDVNEKHVRIVLGTSPSLPSRDIVQRNNNVSER